MKVDFIIAGAQKCGTTALHEFLSKHNFIIGSEPKETDFFNYEKRYQSGLNYYHSYFRKRSLCERLIFNSKFLESSPTYITDGDIELTAKRISKYNRKMKIICLVRNPNQRALSAWNMYRQRYFAGMDRWWYKWMEERTGYTPNVIPRKIEEWENFETFILKELKNLKLGLTTECEVLYMGEYYKGIEIFQKIFQENFLVVQNENLNIQTSTELYKISKFLGIGDFNWEVFDNVKIFKGDYNSRMNNKTSDLLNEYYKESNEKLFKLTGIDYR